MLEVWGYYNVLYDIHVEGHIYRSHKKTILSI